MTKLDMTYSDTFSSLLNDDQHLISLFENILNNPQKMQEIRGFGSLTKDVMLEICYRWLVETDSQDYTVVSQERILVTDDMDVEARRQKDAKERYNNMNGIIKLFCSTINAREHHSFRFNDLGKRDKYELALVLEHVVVRVMGENGCFPLHLVVGSAITNHLLGAVIKNNGNRKKNDDTQQIQLHFNASNISMDAIAFSVVAGNEIVPAQQEELQVGIDVHGTAPSSPAAGAKRRGSSLASTTRRSRSRGRGG
ncbi:hypothetical protein BD408DRAFT_422617 [Parasitella parasitica]|nr:hypothetical protein BD408DRAFT_422617 [Parasitella parasitica]